MPKKKSIGRGAKQDAWNKVRFKEKMFPGVEALFKRKGMIVEEINSSKDPVKTYFKYAEAGTTKALFSPHERRCIIMALIGKKRNKYTKINTKSTEQELEEFLHRIA